MKSFLIGSSETCWDSGRHKKNCFFLSSTLFVTILFVLAMITPVLYYKYRSLGDLKKTVSILNVNDTIIAAKIDPEEKSQVALQLISKTIQHFHIVNLYSTPCNRLMSYMQLGHSAGNFTLNGATKILFPTYFVEGSKIEIEGYILRASTMTVEIELYIFNGLKHVQDFAANLDKRAYEATIYIKGGGPQNTSTPVNYTVPSTDYYFIVLCATAPIHAEFDMTLHKQVYNTSDYSLSCVIEDSTRCSLTYDFHDKQECILAHVVYVPDLEWTPPDIHVTAHPRRNTSTSIFVMSCVGSICFLCIIILLTILFGFCCCKGLLRKRTHYHYIPISSDSM